MVIAEPHLAKEALAANILAAMTLGSSVSHNSRMSSLRRTHSCQQCNMATSKDNEQQLCFAERCLCEHVEGQADEMACNMYAVCTTGCSTRRRCAVNVCQIAST